jgi:hypothetical protein
MGAEVLLGSSELFLGSFMLILLKNPNKARWANPSRRDASATKEVSVALTG